MKILTLTLALTFAFLDVALGVLDMTPIAGMLMPTAAVVAVMLVLGRLAMTPLPE